MTFTGKHVWLIGASEGIGAALAQKLLRAGAKVCISARNEAKMQNVLAGFPPTDAYILPVDATDQASIATAWSQLTAFWPDIDMVIYNAGSYEPLTAQHYKLEQVQRMMDVNLNGILRVLEYVLPYLIARNRGHLALVGSVAGYRGLPAAIGYGASKAAVIHLAENLKADLAHTDIKVQIINPGFVDTRLTQKNDFHMPAMIKPEQAADAIMAGLQSNAFEIHFPKRFTYVLKLLSLLPAGIYFWLLKHAKF